VAVIVQRQELVGSAEEGCWVDAEQDSWSLLTDCATQAQAESVVNEVFKRLGPVPPQ
jgi:hypothetical protein